VTKSQNSDDAERVEALKSLRTTLDWLGDEVHNNEN
jgi:hypothetical protein